MRILVVPDLHLAHNVRQLERRIVELSPDLTLFLGDYFDNYGDSLQETRRTAQWLKDSLTMPSRVHLFGNHELGYVDQFLGGYSGWTSEKYREIGTVLNRDDWSRLTFSHAEGSWLFTHAGLSRAALTHENCNLSEVIPNAESLSKAINDQASTALQHKVSLSSSVGPNHASGEFRLGHDNHWYYGLYKMGKATKSEQEYVRFRHWSWMASFRRGGYAPVPGFLWTDISEFVPIPGINQMFGHTRGSFPRSLKTDTSINYCIDTSLKFKLHHVAVVDTCSNVVQCYRINGSEAKVKEF